MAKFSKAVFYFDNPGGRGCDRVTFEIAQRRPRLWKIEVFRHGESGRVVWDASKMAPNQTSAAKYLRWAVDLFNDSKEGKADVGK